MTPKYIITSLLLLLLIPSAIATVTQYNTTVGGLTLVKFNGTGNYTWTPPAGIGYVDYHVIGGGGSGGNGGGGAGGYMNGTSYLLTTTYTYTIMVGDGGPMYVNGGQAATNGGNSSFSNITAYGGGSGGWSVGGNGSSGGGGGGQSPNYIGYAIYGNQGHNGGLGQVYVAAAGGGSGAVGGAGTGQYGGTGGIGNLSNITGTPTYYSGGGGGGAHSGYAMGGGSGGNGGGGAGGSGAHGTNATPETGGGGGGHGYNNFGDAFRSGAGGSGVVYLLLHAGTPLPLPVPVISFTGNTTGGYIPLAVQFNDTSTAFPTSWYWSFGDDTYSTSQNPIHTYTTAGSYSVTLNSSNAAGYGVESTRLNYITAINPTSSGAGTQYPPHTVKFTVKDRFGNPLPNLNFTATSQETSMGEWDWLSTIWGISDATNIQTSTMMGKTGGDGSISFVMMETIGYQIQITNTTLGISYTDLIYPQEQEFLIQIRSYPSVSLKMLDYINSSISEKINNNKSVTITGHYVDTGGYTTKTTFYVNFTNNTPIYSSTITGAVNNSFQYLIPYVENTSYNYGINATTSYWGFQTSKKTYSFPNFLDLEIPSVYYSWISAAILLLFCAIFSRGNSIFGVIIIPAMASFLVYIGWMPITMGATATILLVLGILIYMRARSVD